MNNKNKTMLNFVTRVIIPNGIRNNFSNEQIKANITEFKKYLIDSDFSDEKTLKIISVIEDKSSEYIELFKAFKEAGLSMPTIQLEIEENKKDKKDENELSEVIDERVGNIFTGSGCGSVRGC